MNVRAYILLALVCTPQMFAQKTVTVAQDGSADYRTVQQAIEDAPPTGATIRIKPGTYKEHITVEKPSIELVGLGRTPADVILTFDLSNGTAGGTGRSASTTVTGDDFRASNLTFENSFSKNRPLTQEGSQAVALRVTGDRAIFRNVRFLGYQDTLYADGKGCDTDRGPCKSARQYFADCYIEGNVDFIFGDALAWFENCEIHALAHSTVMLTAQSKRYDGEESGYVFDHCRITAEEGAKKIYLGRPWRWYASVVFLHTKVEAPLEPAGWQEWVHDDEPSLHTAFYAEYASMGADTSQREPSSKQLTAAEAAHYSVREFLKWDPAK
jgi:pectin methylesterase-like acyl-CoA thioesterase